MLLAKSKDKGRSYPQYILRPLGFRFRKGSEILQANRWHKEPESGPLLVLKGRPTGSQASCGSLNSEISPVLKHGFAISARYYSVALSWFSRLSKRECVLSQSDVGPTTHRLQRSTDQPIRNSADLVTQSPRYAKLLGMFEAAQGSQLAYAQCLAKKKWIAPFFGAWMERERWAQ